MTVEDYEARARRGGDDAVREASRFLYGEGPVHQALKQIAGRLEALGIPYAVVGGMALNAHGYHCTTVDVDVLVTSEGLLEVREKLEGWDYMLLPEGDRLRDTENGVRIDFVVSSEFQDPASVSVKLDGIRYLTLEKLIEMKLSWGMARSGRLKHLADVQEMIKELRLKADLSEHLDARIRKVYTRLWNDVHDHPDPHQEYSS
mgnify:CR=1 FL=1